MVRNREDRVACIQSISASIAVANSAIAHKLYFSQCIVYPCQLRRLRLRVSRKGAKGMVNFPSKSVAVAYLSNHQDPSSPEEVFDTRVSGSRELVPPSPRSILVV